MSAALDTVKLIYFLLQNVMASYLKLELLLTGPDNRVRQSVKSESGRLTDALNFS